MASVTDKRKAPLDYFDLEWLAEEDPLWRVRLSSREASRASAPDRVCVSFAFDAGKVVVVIAIPEAMSAEHVEELERSVVADPPIEKPFVRVTWKGAPRFFSVEQLDSPPSRLGTRSVLLNGAEQSVEFGCR